MELAFGIEKHFTYTVTCGEVDLRHIVIENYGGGTYLVYSYGDEIDVFTYNGDKPFDAINNYLSTYAIENGYV